jgi:hypothetical protein
MIKNVEFNSQIITISSKFFHEIVYYVIFNLHKFKTIRLKLYGKSIKSIRHQRIK